MTPLTSVQVQAVRERVEMLIGIIRASPYWKHERDKMHLDDDLTTLLAALDQAAEALLPFARTGQNDIGSTEADNDLFRNGDRQYLRAPPITVGHFRTAALAHALITGEQQ